MRGPNGVNGPIRDLRKIRDVGDQVRLFVGIDIDPNLSPIAEVLRNTRLVWWSASGVDENWTPPTCRFPSRHRPF
jgi:hypothetical protein